MLPADLSELPALLDRYERPLVRYAQSILGDIEAARDVVQDTFIRWVREGSRKDTERCPAGDNTPSQSAQPTCFDENRTAAWLVTVCRNRALDYQRKHARIVPMEFPEDRAAEDPSPSATLESRDTAASLLQMLDSL